MNEGAAAVVLVLVGWRERKLLFAVGTAVAVEEDVLRVGEGGWSRIVGVRPRGDHSGCGLWWKGGVEELWSLDGEARMG